MRELLDKIIGRTNTFITKEQYSEFLRKLSLSIMNINHDVIIFTASRELIREIKKHPNLSQALKKKKLRIIKHRPDMRTFHYILSKLSDNDRTLFIFESFSDVFSKAKQHELEASLMFLSDMIQRKSNTGLIVLREDDYHPYSVSLVEALTDMSLYMNSKNLVVSGLTENGFIKESYSIDDLIG